MGQGLVGFASGKMVAWRGRAEVMQVMQDDACAWRLSSRLRSDSFLLTVCSFSSFSQTQHRDKKRALLSLPNHDSAISDTRATLVTVPSFVAVSLQDDIPELSLRLSRYQQEICAS